MSFSRLQARYAIWEDSPFGRVCIKLLPLSLFAAVAIASVWYLEGKIKAVTAIQDDQNTVILDQKKRIDALEAKLAASAPASVTSPEVAPPASPEASPSLSPAP